MMAIYRFATTIPAMTPLLPPTNTIIYYQYLLPTITAVTRASSLSLSLSLSLSTRASSQRDARRRNIARVFQR